MAARSLASQAVASLVASLDGRLADSAKDHHTIEYVADLLAQADIDEQEKVETIQGVLELHLTCPQLQADSDSILDAVNRLIVSSNGLLSNSLHSLEQLPDPTLQPGLDSKTSTSHPSQSQSHSQIDLQRDLLIKKSIISNYGLIPEPIQKSTTCSNLNQFKLEQGQEAVDDDLHQEISKDLLDQQLKLLNLKKKQRKKIEAKMTDDDILLRPNLNSALVDHQNQIKRQESSQKAKMKSEKDKLDLIKQRENQAKKKADARARATKLERKC